jgi:uncharacterized protein (UPF0332 family)
VPLHDDLLDQAQTLLRLDPGRPRQANLRRAISAAYYALFHLLIDDASAFLIGGNQLYRRQLREMLARSFDHGRMCAAAREWTQKAPPWRAAALAHQAPHQDLLLVARLFTELQAHRHRADYAVAERFSRAEVRAVLANTRHAFEAWQRVRATPDGEAFGLSLLLKARSA